MINLTTHQLACCIAAVCLLSFIPLTEGAQAPNIATQTQGSANKSPAPALSAPINSTADPASISKIDDLSRRLEVVQNQSRNDGNFVVLGLTFIAVLITVIGLLFPAATYFLSVRPAEKAIADANKAVATLDQRFSELLKKNRENEIDQALNSIADPRAVHVNLAVTTLTFAMLSRDFTSRQMDELVNILRRVARNDAKLQFMGLLVLSPQPSATQYIKDIAQSDAFEQLASPILQYYVATDDHDLKALVKAKVIASKNIESHLNNLANAAWSHSTEAATKFLNDKEFWGATSIATRYNLARNLTQQEGIKTIIDNTLLAQLTKEESVVTLWKLLPNGETVEISSPEESTEIRVIKKDGSTHSYSKGGAQFDELLKKFVPDLSNLRSPA